MKTAGIIAEYNPFHGGHARHLAATRAAGYTHIITALSGCFVQRGEPAVLGKTARTRAALLCGADLVLELPSAYSLSSAKRFALAGTGLLADTGVADGLSFGSECGDLETLRRTARCIESPELQPKLKQFLQAGKSFAAARQAAAEAVFGTGTAEILASPNNLLAAEYLAALDTLGVKMEAFTVKREGAPHGGGFQCGFETQLCGGINHSGLALSASQIRSLLLSGKEFADILPALEASVPADALVTLKDEFPNIYSQKDFETAALSRLRALPRETFEALTDVREGLGSRLFESARRACSLTELYRFAKSKRFTHSRIRRAIMRAAIGMEEGLPEKVPYIRVLGFNGRGQELLAAMRKRAHVPCVTRGTQARSLGGDIAKVFAAECAAADLIALAVPGRKVCGEEFRFNPVRV
ncbi:MAG: nucleotidyltransferase family protein [Oscillospiraceae bacterium]|nr:nucleotidyltransferase family protein [Oscillospiraceae bacterium]